MCIYIYIQRERKKESEAAGCIKVQHNRNETTKIRSQNHLGLLDRKKNDDAFAEVIVYKIYMSLVYGPISAKFMRYKRGSPDGARIEEKPERDVREVKGRGVEFNKY